MRRIICWAGVLMLGLAALLWATAPSLAQHGGHGGGGHGGGGGHAPAHVGSVHYGAHPAPVHAAPVRVAPREHVGAVHAEHYEHSVPRGGYRNPYRAEYVRHFRPGYRSFYLGDAEYYGYDSLPPDCQPVAVDSGTYYVGDGVYYQPYIYEGNTVYLVVPAP